MQRELKKKARGGEATTQKKKESEEQQKNEERNTQRQKYRVFQDTEVGIFESKISSEGRESWRHASTLT